MTLICKMMRLKQRIPLRKQLRMRLNVKHPFKQVVSQRKLW